MKDLCGAKESCDIYVTVPPFPDFCVGQTKILKVWYQCVGDGNIIKF